MAGELQGGTAWCRDITRINIVSEQPSSLLFHSNSNLACRPRLRDTRRFSSFGLAITNLDSGGDDFKFCLITLLKQYLHLLLCSQLIRSSDILRLSSPSILTRWATYAPNRPTRTVSSQHRGESLGAAHNRNLRQLPYRRKSLQVRPAGL